MTSDFPVRKCSGSWSNFQGTSFYYGFGFKKFHIIQNRWEKSGLLKQTARVFTPHSHSLKDVLYKHSANICPLLQNTICWTCRYRVAIMLVHALGLGTVICTIVLRFLLEYNYELRRPTRSYARDTSPVMYAEVWCRIHYIVPIVQ